MNRMGQGMQVNDSAWLSNRYMGFPIITMSVVDVVMTKGVCFLYFVLEILSKPCLSLRFAFTWKAKCLLLLLPPPHQAHLRIAWGWELNPTSVFFYLSCPPDDTSFLCLLTGPFSIVPLHHFPCLLYDLLEMVCIVWEVCVLAHLPYLLNAVRWL